jgi:hypothetical protein
MFINSVLYTIRLNKKIFIDNFEDLCQIQFNQYLFRGRLRFKQPVYTLLLTKKKMN